MAVDKEKMAESMAAQAAAVSKSIREALQASFPVAPEQLMTVQVPGTTINSSKNGGYWWNENEHAETPHTVKVNEARLVDGMIPLSKIMMGPTGKSVSRSYAAALDMLIPEDAPIDDLDKSTETKNKAAERYVAAMKYLTSTVPNSSKSVVDVYVEKQQAWSDAMKEWDQAKQAARDEAKRMFPNSVGRQQGHYDEWNQANFRNYKNHAQAKYMDWIVNGCKYKVDYYFGIVDVSSAMKRVESSKEASRNLVVIDPDGTTEWQEVDLSPPNWADLCAKQAEAWDKKNKELSRKDYESEIKRIKRLLSSYRGLQDSLGKLTDEEKAAVNSADEAENGKKREEPDEEKKLKEAYQALYEAQAAEKTIEPPKDNPANGTTPDTPADTTTNGTTPTKVDLQTAQRNLQAALQAQGQANLKNNKNNVMEMQKMSKVDKVKWIKRMIKDAEGQLELLEQGLKDFFKSNIAIPAIQDLTKSEEDGKELVRTNYMDANERWADPRFAINRNGTAPGQPKEPSKWTKINVSISASSQETSKESQSSSSSLSASGSSGLFSASGGFSYSQASSKASQAAASCNVDISFEALLVTINRNWLHGELFADSELNVGQDVALSPGPHDLHTYINNKDTKGLEKYTYFPSYPTAFVVASNVELEFRGDTTNLEEAIESSSFDANLKVGYGPFSLGASHKQDSSSAKTKMETTATGTRISLEAPAIIGWVSTMLPPLPRSKGENSLIQTLW
ncbi:hypothetical protein B0J15DRAFT_578227 [Fusarium solani]|uniref:Uncharacterized protein n=2 Tax=Fusarium solani TaxID=169388 RepID=A0A9P9R6D1_FUSSL|nr:uncharacterized protein B0J15DRAFT_578227 [Fusarium solani]KAH7268206.1 hypothetical protein B0J15DRAFT_578227 [Fusarium solani]